MGPPARPPFWSSAARWAVSIASSWAHFIPLLLVSPFSHRAAWSMYRHRAKVCCRICNVTVSLRDDSGTDRAHGPHLYVMLNQASLADALAFPQLLPPFHTIVNVEFAAMPLMGWSSVLLGDVVIVRQWKRQAKRGVERAAARLARGESWLISIEGARSPDGRLLPYKKGPVVMALQSQATIVPVAIHGGREVMPRGEWRVRPGHIELHLLEAIPTRGLSYEDRDKVMEQLRAAAERELREKAT